MLKGSPEKVLQNVAALQTYGRIVDELYGETREAMDRSSGEKFFQLQSRLEELQKARLHVHSVALEQMGH